MNRTIAVKGTGNIRLKPDMTVISMTLKTTDKDYDKAMEQASAALSALRDALASVGFAENDLKTLRFNVSTEYESRQDSHGVFKSVFVGYSCIHGLKLEFDFDTKRMSAVLNAISGCIADPELNIQFSVRDKDSACDELLRSAAENAKHKAEVLANASGVSLGQLVSIDYNWKDLNIYSRTEYASNRKCMTMSAGSDMSFEPDDIDLSDSASFIWEIV